MEVHIDRGCGRPTYVCRSRNQGAQNPARWNGTMLTW